MKTIHEIVLLATNEPNELQQCILLGASYVQRVLHALNDHSPDLRVFNATKIVGPRNHPSDENDQITNTALWLERVFLKFQYTKEEIMTCVSETMSGENQCNGGRLVL